jgi:hypothetical protein
MTDDEFLAAFESCTLDGLYHRDHIQSSARFRESRGPVELVRGMLFYFEDWGSFAVTKPQQL